MPQSGAVLNTNTFIMMDVAAGALLHLQVPALRLAAEQGDGVGLNNKCRLLAGGLPPS